MFENYYFWKSEIINYVIDCLIFDPGKSKFFTWKYCHTDQNRMPEFYDWIKHFFDLQKQNLSILISIKKKKIQQEKKTHIWETKPMGIWLAIGSSGRQNCVFDWKKKSCKSFNCEKMMDRNNLMVFLPEKNNNNKNKIQKKKSNQNLNWMKIFLFFSFSLSFFPCFLTYRSNRKKKINSFRLSTVFWGVVKKIEHQNLQIGFFNFDSSKKKVCCFYCTRNMNHRKKKKFCQDLPRKENNQIILFHFLWLEKRWNSAKKDENSIFNFQITENWNFQWQFLNLDKHTHKITIQQKGIHSFCFLFWLK